MFWKSNNKKIHSVSKGKPTANFSKAVYLRPDDRESYLKDSNYIIDNELSNDKILVGYNPISKDTITAFRGTKEGKDWGTNLLVGLGLDKLGSRYKNGLSTTKKVIEKYPDFSVTTSGHSLGGRLSSQIGNKLGLENHNYNGSSSLSDIKNLRGLQSNPKSFNYTTLGDPVGMSSLIGSGGVKNIMLPKKLNVHSINNFA